MPQNITDVTVFTAPIVAPQDGDAETAASVLAGMQGLANRTAYLNNILATTGATLIRSGNAAAMAALTMASGNDGQVFHRNGWGLYRYTNPSALPVDSVWVYTAAGAASGQWVYESYSNLNQSVGLATVGPYAANGTPSGRLAQSIVPYGQFLTPYYNAGPLVLSTTSTSLTALTSTPTITLGLGAGGLLAGDIVELVVPAIYLCVSTCRVVAMVSENGGSFFAAAPLGSIDLQATGASTASAVPLSFIRTVVTPGNYQIQFWGLTNNASNTVVAELSTVYARVFRP